MGVGLIVGMMRSYGKNNNSLIHLITPAAVSQ